MQAAPPTPTGKDLHTESALDITYTTDTSSPTPAIQPPVLLSGTPRPVSAAELAHTPHHKDTMGVKVLFHSPSPSESNHISPGPGQ